MERVLTKPGQLHGNVQRTRNADNSHRGFHVVAVTAAHLSLALGTIPPLMFFFPETTFFFFYFRVLSCYFLKSKNKKKSKKKKEIDLDFTHSHTISLSCDGKTSISKKKIEIQKKVQKKNLLIVLPDL